MQSRSHAFVLAIAITAAMSFTACDDNQKKDEPKEEKPVIYGHDGWLACPQIKKGCSAILVDFSKNNAPKDTNLSAMKDSLTKAGCAVDYVEAPLFADNPAPKNAQKTTDNKAKWADLQKKIDDHAKGLSKGVEVEIVMVRGHGADNLSPCGWWGPGFPSDAGLNRDAFLKQLYTAVKQNACGWAVYDGSCFGGLSPKAVDELENKGAATCTTGNGKPGPNHPQLHAAFLSDDAASTGGMPGAAFMGFKAGSCDDAKIKKDLDNWKDVVDKEAKKTVPAGGVRDYFEMADGLRQVMQGQFSYYLDDGYKACQQAVHPHKGY